ncbi:MAG: ComEC/Rec2 family competence protein [Lachnospiraceae bacterium]|nr:ComEC/Rec2 family competence protein [Lachnospiraceae bacterium]
MKKRPLAYIAIFIVLGEALGLMAFWQGLLLCILFLMFAGWKEKSRFALFLFGIIFLFYAQGVNAKKSLLQEKERDGTLVTITGTVTESFEGENPYFYLKTEEIGDKVIQVKVLKSTVSVEKGDKVKVQGELSCFSEPTNPGEFHVSYYYHSIGISYQCISNQVTILKENQNLFYQLSKNGSRMLKEFYFQFMKAENAGILTGILLGDKTGLSEEDKIRYQEAGISHILAISGLHMGCIGMSLFRFLRKRRVSYFSSAFLAILILLLYTFMVGNSVSMERAFLMLFIVLIGEVMGRKSDLLTTLSLVAAIVVVKQPFVLLHSTFYLSFLAVYSLAVFPGWIEKVWKGKSVWKQYFMSGFCVQLGLFPVFAESNHYLVTYSFLTNFLVLFFFSYFLTASILISILSFVLPKTAGFLLNFIEIYLEGVRFITKINQMLPCYKIRIPHNPWWWYAIYYVLIVLSFYILGKSSENMVNERCSKDRKRKVWDGYKELKQNGLIKSVKVSFCTLFREKKSCFYVLCFWLLFFFGMYGFHHQGKLHVAVLDVGQGDGILLKQEGGINLLIDGGSSSKKQLGKYILVPAMDYYGIEQIDYAFVSHLDADHISGVVELLEMGKIKKVVISAYTAENDLKDSELMQYLNDENTMIVTEGMELYQKDLKIKILSPENDGTYENANESSMVMELSYHGKTMLFTGDIGEDTEAALLEKVSKEIDFLKVPHHGSKYSTSEPFLDRIKPTNAVISCGNNHYGHPSEEVLERLIKRGIRIHNTKEEGAMVFVIP